MLVAGPDESRISFKAEYKKRLKREWKELYKNNPALYSMVLHLAGFCGLTICKDIFITQIWRSEDEQKSIYGPHTKRTSPHQNWCAVDLRCKDFTGDERAHLERALRVYDHFNKFRHMPSGSRTVWIHRVDGGGIHFHIQFWGFDRALPSCFQLPARDLSSTA